MLRGDARVKSSMSAGSWLALVALVALGCSSSLTPSADGGGDVQQHDPAAACGCRIDDDGALVMSWDCYCRTWGCDGRLACSVGQERSDYPGCGLTVVSRQSFGITSSVYDTSGALVGQTIQSDTTPYTCPTNSALSGAEVRAGQAPAASCAGVACGACTTAAFPCAATDGGIGP